ncbi:MAG: phosphatidate cytidylyltransferase [Hyphomicrobiales bacterium]
MNDVARPEGRSRWRDLGVRVASAAVLIPIVLVDAWAGGGWFLLVVGAIGAIMAKEWCRIVFASDLVQTVLHTAASIGALAIALEGRYDLAVVFAAALWGGSIAISAFRGEPLSKWTVLGVPYVSLPPLAMLGLRQDPDFGLAAILFLFAVVWAADTAAYFSGRIIGGPKLWPSISPNKTWAGLYGAMGGAAIAGAATGAFAGLPSLWPVTVIAAVLAVVEQGGDLFESALKRAYGFKDAGRLIPGHGGLLDRVDGLVAAAVAAALLGVVRGGFAEPARGLLVW